MHVSHRWNVHFLIMYGSFPQNTVEVAAENSRALCNKSLRCLWKMIEIALKSSRDYCEKWWRLLRKVVAITAKDGVVRRYAHSLCPIIPTQKVGPCIAKPTFFFCFPDTVLLSLQAICRYFPPPSRFLLVEKVGAMWLIG